MSSEMFDKNGTYRLFLENYSKEVQTSGGVTYTAYSVPGTELYEAKWRAESVVDATGVRKFANEGEFTCVATDLTTLYYGFGESSSTSSSSSSTSA